MDRHGEEDGLIQSHENRMDALRSVLPLLELHLDLIAPVKSALGGAWESEPSPLDSPPEPHFPGPIAYCRVLCPVCKDALRCTDEAWVRLQQEYRRDYRLDAIASALADLGQVRLFGQTRAAAIYWEYVCYWREWNPQTRRQWADEGLSYMSEKIPGPLFPFCTVGREKASRNEEIVRLREQGLSYHKISKQLGVSKTTVNAALHGKRVLQGRTVYATGS